MFRVEVSPGEVVDKLSILKIKLKNISDVNKFNNILAEYEKVEKEYYILVSEWISIQNPESKDIDDLQLREEFDIKYLDPLVEVNQTLWDIEDEIRKLEAKKIPDIFDEYFYNDRALDDTEAREVGEFVTLARSVYQNNDLRFELKSKVNKIFVDHSSNVVVEEKSYAVY